MVSYRPLTPRVNHCLIEELSNNSRKVPRNKPHLMLKQETKKQKARHCEPCNATSDTH